MSILDDTRTVAQILSRMDKKIQDLEMKNQALLKQINEFQNGNEGNACPFYEIEPNCDNFSDGINCDLKHISDINSNCWCSKMVDLADDLLYGVSYRGLKSGYYK